MPPSAGHSRMTTVAATTAPYPSTTVQVEPTTQQLHYSQNDVDSGQQRNLALHALLQQMGSSYQPAMTNLTHQMAAAQQQQHQLSHQMPLGNIQVQAAAMGHPPPHSMQGIYALAPQQQLLQGHHPGLSTVSTLPTVQGLHLGALLSQEQQQQPMPVTAPEPMRNGREDIRKHKDDVHDDRACFYMKKTNDLDRFLTEATPMLSLDASLEPQKALDQLTLVIQSRSKGSSVKGGDAAV